MNRSRCRKLLARSLGVVLACGCGVAAADEATGKVVWIDARNSSLLLECPDKGCPQIPNSKTGETYTFVIPAAMKKQVEALKEGQTVKILYDDAKEKGYVITAVDGR